MLFNLVFTMEVFLLTKNLLTLLLALPIHGVCMLLCARDARFFDLLLLWAKTRLPAYSAASGSGRARATAHSRSICRIAGGVAHLCRGRVLPDGPRSPRMKRAGALRRELPAAAGFRTARMSLPQLVRTRQETTCRCFRLAGASFESADDEVLNNWHERLNVLWRNIASPQRRAVDARDPPARVRPRARPADEAGVRRRRSRPGIASAWPARR